MSLPLLRDNSSMKNSRFCIWVLAILFFLKTILKIKSYSLKKRKYKIPFWQKKKKRKKGHTSIFVFAYLFSNLIDQIVPGSRWAIWIWSLPWCMIKHSVSAIAQKQAHGCFSNMALLQSPRSLHCDYHIEGPQSLLQYLHLLEISSTMKLKEQASLPEPWFAIERPYTDIL